MIYKSLLEEGINDGIIQGPDMDDIGNDLEAIAKSVEESHDEEVEDAQDGFIGEPVEEFAMIMYESEYNFNQIMQAIGMAELREAAMGRELVLEAADIKGFFKKIKEFFVNMFQRITDAVRNVLIKLDLQVKADKKFVTENEAYIKIGFDGDWSALKGYKINNNALNAFKPGENGEINTTLKKGLSDNSSEFNAIDTLKQANIADMDKIIADTKKWREKARDNNYIKGLGYDGVENSKDLRNYIHNILFGKEKISLKGEIALIDVLDTLKNDRDTRKIRANHNALKQEFAKILKDIKDFESTCTKVENANVYISAVQALTNLIKIDRSICNTAFVEAISAARYKRNICRKIAHECVKLANEKGKYKPKTESATGSLFDNIAVL